MLFYMCDNGKSFQKFFFHPRPFPECFCYLRLKTTEICFFKYCLLLYEVVKCPSIPKAALTGCDSQRLFIKSETTAEPILQLWFFKVVSTRSLKTGQDARHMK